jgi:hypothetical protein
MIPRAVDCLLDKLIRRLIVIKRQILAQLA